MKDEVVRVTAAETGYHLFGVSEYTSAGAWKKLYLSLNGHKFLEYANGTTYFFHTDHLGTPRVQSNLAGAVVETWRAYPYGEQWQQSGRAGATHRYTGKERDQESANDYFGARYYWSGAGRWLSLDPVAEDGRSPQRLNRYSYVLNDPISYKDPDGRRPWKECYLIGWDEYYEYFICETYFLVNADPKQRGNSGPGKSNCGRKKTPLTGSLTAELQQILKDGIDHLSEKCKKFFNNLGVLSKLSAGTAAGAVQFFDGSGKDGQLLVGDVIPCSGSGTLSDFIQGVGAEVLKNAGGISNGK